MLYNSLLRLRPPSEWASADTWPPAGVEMTRLYLRSGGA